MEIFEVVKLPEGALTSLGGALWSGEALVVGLIFGVDFAFWALSRKFWVEKGMILT